MCDITRDRGIPRDKLHIVAHGQLQPHNRIDPGPNWPWASYLQRIEQHCVSALIVDSNNGANNAARARIESPRRGHSHPATGGHYGTGYAFAATQAVSDPATFWFYLDAPATRTIDAWWTSGTNRAPSAPYLVWTATGERLATVYVNQQGGGSRWNTLGTWSFPAGWNTVQLSRWTTRVRGGADAIESVCQERGWIQSHRCAELGRPGAVLRAPWSLSPRDRSLTGPTLCASLRALVFRFVSVSGMPSCDRITPSHSSAASGWLT